MLIKKLRLDIISDDEKKKIIQTELCKIENNVCRVLANKDREVRENKLAFSAVARENTEVKEKLVKSEAEIIKKNGELAECYRAFQHKEEELRKIIDDNIKKENELNRYKKIIEKIDEKHNKYEIEKGKLVNELLNSNNEAGYEDDCYQYHEHDVGQYTDGQALDTSRAAFKDPEELLQFLTKDEQLNHYACTLCLKTIKQRKDARNHVESIHFPNTFVYSCAICEKTFNSKNTRNVHITRNHNKKIIQ